MLTKTQIRAAIEKVLQQVQTASGRTCPKITDSTKPIGDLDGFDSLMAVEATILVEQELGVTLENNTTPFTSGGSKRALTVAKIVDRIAAMIASPRAA